MEYIKLVISGTRLTGEYILNLLANGSTYRQIREEYNDLTSEDMQACLLFATRALEGTDFVPPGFEKLHRVSSSMHAPARPVSVGWGINVTMLPRFMSRHEESVAMRQSTAPLRNIVFSSPTTKTLGQRYFAKEDFTKAWYF